jgi:Flp pilus assembly CpaF family ATPase
MRLFEDSNIAYVTGHSDFKLQDFYEQQKRNRLMDNFIDDIFPIKKYLEDPAVTDIFVIGTGEIIPPPYNARITGMLPPWVASPEITLRKPPRVIFPLEDYVEKKRLSPSEYDKEYSMLLCPIAKTIKTGYI